MILLLTACEEIFSNSCDQLPISPQLYFRRLQTPWIDLVVELQKRYAASYADSPLAFTTEMYRT